MDEKTAEEVMFGGEDVEVIENVFYDPSESGNRPRLLLGTFPAHLIEWKEGQEHNGSIPFNPTFKIATEAEGLTGIDLNNGDTVDAKCCIGQTVKGKGIWLDPNPTKENRWRNKGYVEFSEALQFKLPEVEDPEDKEKKLKNLVKLDEYEILGRPIMITIEKEMDKRPGKEGNFFPKVFYVSAWDNGKMMEEEKNSLLEDEEETTE